MTELDFIRGRNKLIPAARVIRSLLIGKGDPMQAYAFAEAKGRWDATPEVAVALQKAITAPMSTVSDSSALWSRIGTQICEALQPLTIYGRLQPYMRRVPFRTRVCFSSDSTEARFVSEATTGAGTSGSAIPVTRLSFSESGEVATLNMDFAKLAIIAVHTADLARMGPAGTDEFIAGELLKSLVRGLDKQFIDPSRLYDTARSAPASVTSAGTVISSAGAALANVDSDLGLMIAALDTNGMNLASAHWVLSPTTATSLARLRGSGGAPAYPGIGARGGELLGLPAITSAACAAEGSPGERFIALVEAGEVTFADDAGAAIEYATHAALEMDSGPTGGASQMRSLWQHDLAAVKVQRYVNWQARSGATAVLRDVTY